VFNVLRAACINPVLHYKLPTGQAKQGDPANFIVVEDLTHFKVKQTYINGVLVAEDGKSFIPFIQETSINQFDAATITESSILVPLNEYPSNEDGLVPVMEAIDGQLITNCHWMQATIHQNLMVSNTQEDVLKMVVYNRYFNAPPKMAFIKNFGFKQGAIASTVAHDSHNIIAVGVDDASIVKAINLVIAQKGGISCVKGNEQKVLGLTVAGLMSTQDPYTVAQAYTEMDQMAKELGSSLGSPFMTLSFMALLVIPHLKLSDKGLFDGDAFKLF
jgi:adenine deaminase